MLLTVVYWQNEFSHAGDTGWEFSVENVFCNAKIYSCEMSSFRYLRFFFSVFHQKYKIREKQSALDCAAIKWGCRSVSREL